MAPHLVCVGSFVAAPHGAVCAGLLPYVMGIILNNSTIVYSGILLMGAAVGDFMVLITILKEKKTCFVIDHPTLCGCIIYKFKNSKENYN